MGDLSQGLAGLTALGQRAGFGFQAVDDLGHATRQDVPHLTFHPGGTLGIHFAIQGSASEVLRLGYFTLNTDSRFLRIGKTEYHLTSMMARLMEVFMRNPGEVLSREFLMKHVWRTDYLGDTRTIEVHIRWLREMIEDDANHPCYLQTIRGVGYRLDVTANT